VVAVLCDRLEVLHLQKVAGTEHVPEVAYPNRPLRRRRLGVGVLVIKRVVAVGPQHYGPRLVEDELGIDDAHQVDHPQVEALIPRTVVIDGARFAVGYRTGEYRAARL